MDARRTEEGVYAEFRASNEHCIAQIKQLLADTKDYDADFVYLAKWLLTNKYNPYCYLDEPWAGYTKDACGMLSLLSELSHAMVDDGDLTFCKMGTVGWPKPVRVAIVFKWVDDFDHFEVYKTGKEFVAAFEENERRLSEWRATVNTKVKAWHEGQVR